MTSTNPDKDTEAIARVLFGLRQLLQKSIGTNKPFTSETRLFTYLRECLILDELDFMEVLRDIEHYFGVPAKHPDWDTLLQLNIADATKWRAEVEDRLTFLDLASFIAARMEAPSFSSQVIFGRPCAAATAFKMIEEIALCIDPNMERFAPSTPIVHRLTGARLRSFWLKVRWRSESRIPPLRVPILTALARLMVGAIVLTGAYAVWGVARIGPNLENVEFFTEALLAFTYATTIGLSVIAIAIAMQVFLKRTDAGIPHGIRTFGDLARLIASDRDAMAEHWPRTELDNPIPSAA